jgi:hypothetical protein
LWLECEYMDGIEVAQDRWQWEAFVITMMHSRVSQWKYLDLLYCTSNPRCGILLSD